MAPVKKRKRVVRVHQGPKGGMYYTSSKGKRKYVTNTSKRYSVPPVRRLRGRGDYKSLAGSALSKGGSYLGGKIGGMLGSSSIGSSIGGGLGKLLGGFLGFGDYKFRRNTLLGIGGKATMGGPPRVSNTPDGGVMINHREYIGDIFASTEFASTTYSTQPGDKVTFPWLSQVAAQFETYEMLGCVFFYESHSANALNSTNTALGKVMMSTEVNSANPDFATQREMMNTRFFSSGKPSEHLLHPIECAPGFNPLDTYYVRTGSKLSIGEQDIQLYDMCKVQVATVGQQAPPVTVPPTRINLGSLFVSYNIMLKNPVLGLERTVPYAQYDFAGTIEGETPLGVGTELKTYDNIGLTLGSSSITFPAESAKQQFLVTYWCIGTAPGEPVVTATWELPTVGTPQNADAQFLNVFAAKTAYQAPGATAVDVDYYVKVCAFETGTNGAVLVLGAAVLPDAVTQAGLIVTTINPGSGNTSPAPPDTALLVASAIKHAQEHMSPYEAKLRAWIADPRNKNISDEAKMMMFDRMDEKHLYDDASSIVSVDTLIEGAKKLKINSAIVPDGLRQRKKETKSRDLLEVKEDYVDLSASQLLSMAVNKVKKTAT